MIVKITAANEPGNDRRERLVLCVEDDGPGIPDDQAQRVRARGARADAATPGHGLGLAVVQEFADLYEGELVMSRSSLGGAAVEVRL